MLKNKNQILLKLRPKLLKSYCNSNAQFTMLLSSLFYTYLYSWIWFYDPTQILFKHGLIKWLQMSFDNFIFFQFSAIVVDRLESNKFRILILDLQYRFYYNIYLQFGSRPMIDFCLPVPLISLLRCQIRYILRPICHWQYFGLPRA